MNLYFWKLGWNFLDISSKENTGGSFLYLLKSFLFHLIKTAIPYTKHRIYIDVCEINFFYKHTKNTEICFTNILLESEKVPTIESNRTIMHRRGAGTGKVPVPAQTDPVAILMFVQHKQIFKKGTN
jgi:hypothetical protein